MKYLPFVSVSSIAALLVSATFVASNAADLKIVSSIKPVHSLVSAVLGEKGSSSLLMRTGDTPHSFNLRPSQAQDLEAADVIFWIGPEIESFLSAPLKSLAGDAKVVTLEETEGLVRQETREGGEFEEHGHHDEHDKHDDHDEKHGAEKHGDEHHKDHDDHDKGEKHHKHEEAHADEHAKEHGEKHGKEDHHDEKNHEKDDHDEHAKHESHDDHDGHEFDAHIWLDPQNASAMVSSIAKTLSAIDPANASEYAANAATTQTKLKALTSEIATLVEPAKGKPFIVFHDAYQSFEVRFGLEALGSLTINPQINPGAERIDLIQKKIASLSAVCVFAEPQFKSSMVDVVIEGTDARKGVLDPLGSTIEGGPELYFTLIKNMATTFRDCLQG